MKALKEKRISLRSLWRRGLVILSLFALVFASCNSTDEEDTSGQGNTATGSKKVLAEIIVTKQPANDSYEGLPIDLTGLEAKVRYEDSSGGATWVPVTDLTKIKVTPNIGLVSADSGGMLYHPEYTFLYVEDGGYLPVTINQPDIIPLKRSDTRIITGDPKYGTYTFYSAEGLQMTYIRTWNQKNVYVDGKPDFNGLICDANYTDGYTLPIDPSSDIVRWQILPWYDNPVDPDQETGTGALALTVGYYEERDRNGSLVNLYPGVTVFATYEEVYHVTKIEVENLQQEDIPAYFYWQDDGNKAWVERLAETKASIKVTYSNKVEKNFSIQDLIYENKVYWNDNTVVVDGTYVPFGIGGIKDTMNSVNDKKLTAGWPKFTKPQITLYYRGRKAWIDVPIYDTIKRVEATWDMDKWSERITVNMQQAIDNDMRLGGSAAWLANLLTVTAYFTASSDKTLEAPFVLKFEQASDLTDAALGKQFDGNSLKWADDVIDNKLKVLEDYYGGPEVYTMDFGVFGATTAAGWGQCNDAANGKNKNITIYYDPGLVNPTANAGTGIRDLVPGQQKVVKFKVPVTWEKVPYRSS